MARVRRTSGKLAVRHQSARHVDRRTAGQIPAIVNASGENAVRNRPGGHVDAGSDFAVLAVLDGHAFDPHVAVGDSHRALGRVSRVVEHSHLGIRAKDLKRRSQCDRVEHGVRAGRDMHRRREVRTRLNRRKRGSEVFRRLRRRVVRIDVAAVLIDIDLALESEHLEGVRHVAPHGITLCGRNDNGERMLADGHRVPAERVARRERSLAAVEIPGD